MSVRALAGCVLVFLIGLGATTASAQCAAGRVVTESTAGRCCWPGQSWDAGASRCEGPPACPAGRAASGDECVVVDTTPGISPTGAFVGGDRRVIGTRIDDGFTIAGAVTLGIGYAYGIVIGSLTLGSAGWSMYIPVVGGYLWPIFHGNGLVFGLPGAAVQTTGLVLLIVGLVANIPVYEGEIAEGSPRSGGLRLTGGPGEAGVGLRWDF